MTTSDPVFDALVAERDALRADLARALQRLAAAEDTLEAIRTYHPEALELVDVYTEQTVKGGVALITTAEHNRRVVTKQRVK